MEEIFQNLLSEVEAHPDLSIEDVIDSLAGKYALSADDIAEIHEAFSMLNAINDKAIDLAEKKAEGRTRNGWVCSQLDSLSDRVGDDSVVTEIVSAVKSEVDNIESQD